METADIDSPIAREHIVGVLWRACREGDLKAAQWVSDEFQLTADDARAYDNRALRDACRHSHLAVAAWLVERFEMWTFEDGRVRENEMLVSACARGDRATFDWLVDTYQLSADDARARGNAALSGACAAGSVDVVEAMLWTFGLGATDLIQADAVAHARRGGHRRLARNLARTFELGLDADDDESSSPEHATEGVAAPAEDEDAVDASLPKWPGDDEYEELCGWPVPKVPEWPAPEAPEPALQPHGWLGREASAWAALKRDDARARSTELLKKIVPRLLRARGEHAVFQAMVDSLPALRAASLGAAGYLELLAKLPGNLGRNSSAVLDVFHRAGLVSHEDVMQWYVDADQDSAAVHNAERFIRKITGGAPARRTISRRRRGCIACTRTAC